MLDGLRAFLARRKIASAPRIPVTAGVEPSGSHQARILDACHDGIRVLVGLARSDGDFAASEMVRIEAYCRKRCASLRLPLSSEDLTFLRRFAANQNPDGSEIETSLMAIMGDRAHRRQVIQQMIALVQADGHLDEAEMDMLEYLNRMMEG